LEKLKIEIAIDVVVADPGHWTRGLFGRHSFGSVSVPADRCWLLAPDFLWLVYVN